MDSDGKLGLCGDSGVVGGGEAVDVAESAGIADTDSGALTPPDDREKPMRPEKLTNAAKSAKSADSAAVDKGAGVDRNCPADGTGVDGADSSGALTPPDDPQKPRRPEGLTNGEIAPTIAQALREMPAKPGVYLYYEGEKLLYVGKAKSLRARVRSYFAFTPALRPGPRVSERIAHMLRRASELRYLLAPSELDALVLENSLIKQLRPSYNILLRDDKTYPYICVNFAERWPRLELVRRVERGRQRRYFGPYATGAKALLAAIYGAYKLRQKKSCKKRCLFAQIGRCMAPCELAVGVTAGVVHPLAKRLSAADASAACDTAADPATENLANAYAAELKEAIKALKNPRSLLAKMEQNMLAAAEAERFEDAAKIRDDIRAIERASAAHSELDLARDVSFDAIAVAQAGRVQVAVRLVVLCGRVCSIIIERAANADEAEFLRAFILSQYAQLAPRKIYLERPHEDAQLLAAAIYERTGTRAQIAAAKSPDVRALLAAAKQNALEKGRAAHEEELAAMCALSAVPQRFEVFDNSMMAGCARVGAMVVYDGGWQKAAYRKYLVNARNDYEQMREVLSRRIARFGENPPPDLWVIDGGAALLDLARALLADVGIKEGEKPEVIAISKEKRASTGAVGVLAVGVSSAVAGRGRGGAGALRSNRAKGAAKDVLYTSAGALRLGASSAALQFAQMLRDEAHRFAISAHRSLKRREDLAASELAAAGVSAAVQAKLLRYFGTYEAIKSASTDELKALCGAVSARKITALGEAKR